MHMNEWASAISVQLLFPTAAQQTLICSSAAERCQTLTMICISWQHQHGKMLGRIHTLSISRHRQSREGAFMRRSSVCLAVSHSRTSSAEQEATRSLHPCGVARSRMPQQGAEETLSCVKPPCAETTRRSDISRCLRRHSKSWLPMHGHSCCPCQLLWSRLLAVCALICLRASVWRLYWVEAAETSAAPAL
jgi:hypothetical protein